MTYARKISGNCLFYTTAQLVNMERGYFRIDLAFKLRKNQKEDDMG